MRIDRRSRILIQLLETAIVATAYIGAAWLGRLLAVSPENVTPVWPPSGVALAAVLIVAYRIWPGIFVGAFVASMWTFFDSSSASAIASLGAAAGSTLQAVLGAYLIVRITGARNPLTTRKGLLVFLGVEAACVLISPTLGTISAQLGGLIDSDEFGKSWFTWWLGDIGGVLVFAPLLLAWAQKPKVELKVSRIVEITVMFALLFSACQFVFSGLSPYSTLHYPMAYIPTAVLVWAALRFSQQIVVVANLMLAVTATYGTLSGFGTFGIGSPQTSLTLLELYLATVIAVVLLLSAVETERARLDEALAQEREHLDRLSESEALLGGIFERAGIGIAITGARGNVVDVNPALGEMLGRSREEIREVGIAGVTHPDYLTADSELLKEFDSGRLDRYQFERRYIRKDGKVIWARVIASVIRRLEPEGTLVVGMVEDITERKQAQDALAKSEARFRTIFDKAPVGLALLTFEGQMVEVNPALSEMFGYNIDEMKRIKEEGLTYPEDLQRNRAILEKLETGRIDTHVWDTRYIRKNGELFWVQIGSSLIRDTEGKPYQIISVLVDVNDRKKLEADFREAERRFRSLVEFSPLVVVVYSPDGRVSSASKSLYKLMRIDPELTWAALEKDYNILEDRNFAGVMPYLKRAFAGESLEIPLVRWEAEIARRHYGDVFRESKDLWIKSAAFPVKDTEGNLREVVMMFQDVTMEKEAEDFRNELTEELEQRVAQRTQQLEYANKELEAFTYSVTHDLRAPLRSIDGFSQALLEDYYDSLDSVGKDYIGRVRAATVRMSLLIDDMLRLSRVTRAEIRKVRTDLSNVALEISRQLQETEPQRRVKFDIEPDVVVMADPDLLRLALENLLDNAWKFTVKKDVGRIEFGRMTIEGEQVYYVRDNGAGFDMTYADRLFKPFQRLHSEREFSGTGIGLAIFQRVISRHGGRVWAEGEVENGATFYFTLQE